jgi:hypothetical protein
MEGTKGRKEGREERRKGERKEGREERRKGGRRERRKEGLSQGKNCLCTEHIQAFVSSHFFPQNTVKQLFTTHLHVIGITSNLETIYFK